MKSVDIGNNEIGSGDVKDNSVNTFDVHSFLGVDVVDNTLTGDDIDESTLNVRSHWFDLGGPPGVLSLNRDFSCGWEAYDTNHNTPGYTRDPAGRLHLKGLVRLVGLSGPGPGCVEANGAIKRIFNLLPSYRPEVREVHTTLSNGALARINVDGPAAFREEAGAVSIDPPTTVANSRVWLSLDGISFQCSPSGQNGCP